MKLHKLFFSNLRADGGKTNLVEVLYRPWGVGGAGAN